ncbi:MAG: winged helix-turn-helix domain-containing protein [Gammaproteobacteria bacterium]|nr:winged helix-turn-helix domain-containing protein [Gammaproteobacteria bacterium]MDX2487611.1 winged helix-turn-helix domain-containing protein [Gammaproteobacteria bacterium]
MDSLSQKAFFIGDWKVSPTEGLLLRGDDVVHIEPKAMELLVYLAQRQGEVVAREDIEKDVWGGTLVSYDSITSTVIKLRKALQDNAKEPDYIATIPKRGYELIASVGEQEDPGTHEGTQSIGLQNTNKSTWYFLFAGFLVVAVGVAWFALSASVDPVLIDESNVPPISKENIAQQPLETPSIAVLPFDNMSGDPEQEYFSDGITEDIITDLSRLKNLAVIARNSSFTYKDTTSNVVDIGDDLKVSHVLEGSVRRSGDRVRITAQLIDASNGQHIWAERYDRELNDVFAVQDEITEQIVTALSVQLSSDEEKHRANNVKHNFEAYDLLLKGRRVAADDVNNAIALYKEAISLDPELARAYGSLAIALTRQAIIGYTDEPVEVQDRALELAQKAVSIDPTSPQTLFALGFVYLWKKQFSEASEMLEKAIDIAPNYADGYGLLALIYNNLGKADKAISLIEKGMQINPHYTFEYSYVLGSAYYALSEYQKAVNYLETAIERNQAHVPTRLYLTASYVQLGRLDDAEWQITELEMRHPSITLSHWESVGSIVDGTIKNRLFEDLRTAGMAE